MQYQVLNEITISRSALINNYHYFANLHPNSLVAPVIKANAYGHGLIQTASIISSSLSSVPFVCVDSLYEAYELTKNKFVLPILIMGYTNPKNYQVRKKLPYYFGVSDLLSLDSLGKYQKHAIIHLELDTGMSRLGFTSVDLPHVLTLLNKYPHLRVEGLYSHFAVSDDPNKLTYTKSQINSFKVLATFLSNHGVHVRYRHIAATAGAELQSDPYFNLIRPGLGFYGYTPYGPRTTEGLRQRKYLTPALTLTSHLAHLKTLQPGQAVGYGLTYRAKQTECLATLPLGYHEGVSRGLSNLGYVSINTTLCPIVGRVSMNMTTIKIPRTHYPNLNDPVTVINPDPQAKNSVYAIAKSLDTIPYTVLTQLHSSIRRRVTV